MAKRTKVPRASIACTILDDPEYMGLMQTSAGRDAFALFCALLAAAKAQDNKGSFKHPAPVVAAIIRWPVAEYKAALATLCADTNWVSCGEHVVTIRSFKKWNSWGGKREQDESKITPKMEPRSQQDCSKSGAKPATPVSVTVSDTNKTTTLSADKPPKPRKPHWSEPHGSRLAALPGCPAGGPWSFLSKLAREHTEAAVLSALARSAEEDFANWKHASGWIAKVAAGSRHVFQEDPTW